MPLPNEDLAPVVRHLIHDPCLPRRGNAFDIRRPAPPRSSKSPHRSHAALSTHPTVLVVGDAAGSAVNLAEILTGAGMEVLRAGDDPQALPTLSPSGVDLVLLDVVMPSAAGFEMFRHLRGGDEPFGTPILFASAAEDAGARLAGFAAGATDHVSKPFEPDALLARVRLHLELRHLRRGLANKGRLHRGAEVQLEQAVAQAVLVVDPAGQVVFCTQSARELLVSRLPAFDPATTRLPGLLRDEPFTPVPGRPRLSARRVGDEPAGVHEGGFTVLLLREEPLDPGEVLLTTLKLTRSEANVLYWVREGKTSPEIAVILGAALPTVKKHLEHVFEKLGVETRTAAALLASEVLQRQNAVR